MLGNKLIINVLPMFTVSILSFANPAAITQVRKLLIDTDAGSDDAVAIIMAAESEKLNEGTEVVGITCVNGNTYVDTVALNVLKTLKAVNRLDIPVYKGATQPLLLPNHKDNFYSTDAFGDFYYHDPPSVDLIKPEHAVDVMIRLVKNHPGELTILALGPLTNIALAIRMYPRFLDDVQQLIMMGGNEGRVNTLPLAEFNFASDPIASFIVFNSSTSKPTTLVPVETTNRASVSMSFVHMLENLPSTKSQLTHSAIDGNSNDTDSNYCDAVAAAVALTSGSIVTQSALYYLEIIYEGTRTAGTTVIDYANVTKNSPNTHLIRNVSVDVLRQLLLRYLS